MADTYDSYYQTENLFGQPYPELISFLTDHPTRGKLLDLGCGQGRDAIPLARLGYEVIGIDISSVGIAQMNKIAQAEQLKLKGIVADIYTFDSFQNFDFILLDSLFHFYAKDKKKEIQFIQNIISKANTQALIIFCIPNTGKKVKILQDTIDFQGQRERVAESDFQYEYKNRESGHSSTTNYKMIVVKMNVEF